MVHSPSFLKHSGARLIFGIVNEVHLGESKTGATVSRYLQGSIEAQDMAFQVPMLLLHE